MDIYYRNVSSKRISDQKKLRRKQHDIQHDLSRKFWGGGISVDDIAQNLEPSGNVILGNVAILDNSFRKKARITSVSGGATSIGSESFRDCSNIASIMLHNITGQIGAYSMRDCINLEIADLGSCTQINSQAFYNDYKFQTLILRRTSLCVLQNTTVFQNTPIRGYNGLSGTIYVPKDLVESYKTASNWSSIFNEGHVTFTAIEGSIYEL